MVILLRGKRTKELAIIFNTNYRYDYDSFYINTEDNLAIPCNYKRNIIEGNTTIHKEVFINKFDVKKISTVYKITGDLETSLMYLIEE